METNLTRVKERLEKETAAHLETKQRVSELEYRASELDRQVNCERGERHRLERLVSSGSLPDDTKVKWLHVMFAVASTAAPHYAFSFHVIEPTYHC
jgi:dishevelled associated activator of morphogenesis